MIRRIHEAETALAELARRDAMTGLANRRASARTLGSAVREVDRWFRIGGEEFAVLLVGTNLHGAAVVAERARAAMEQRTVTTEEGVDLTVTASIGLALADVSKPDELFQEADAALYEAKSTGRNRVVAMRTPQRAAQNRINGQRP